MESKTQPGFLLLGLRNCNRAKRMNEVNEWQYNFNFLNQTNNSGCFFSNSWFIVGIPVDYSGFHTLLAANHTLLAETT